MQKPELVFQYQSTYCVRCVCKVWNVNCKSQALKMWCKDGRGCFSLTFLGGHLSKRVVPWECVQNDRMDIFYYLDHERLSEVAMYSDGACCLRVLYFYCRCQLLR